MTRDNGWTQWLVRGADFDPRDPPAIDFHVHSTWTDGLSSNRENLSAARSQRLAAIAITEHVNTQSHWYPGLMEELARLRPEAGLAVYCGAEIACADYGGTLKADAALVQQPEIVIGVVHRYPREGGGFYQFAELSRDEAIRLEVRALGALAANPAVDVLGHPGGTCWRHYGPFPVEALRPVLVAAREHDVAVELNARYLWDPAAMLRLLRQINPLVSCGSDAHHASEIGRLRHVLGAHVTESSHPGRLQELVP